MNSQIDSKKTKKAVERSIAEFRMYMLQSSLDNLPTITTQYSLVPPSGGFNGSSTEKSALKNVDYARKREKVMEKTISAVNKLSYKERSIITKRYMIMKFTPNYICLIVSITVLKHLPFRSLQ